ncbi:hypothetical protein K0M31_009385 [Melipona bicolor]|uniref:Uncharacterized protein n=1 Tax=Melipona bicolor TaxID=60889 RepID=A0AA40FNL0_9HYME|nr:hypothetical protein K0M31_009385 [Melipona bicolor]
MQLHSGAQSQFLCRATVRRFQVLALGLDTLRGPQKSYELAHVRAAMLYLSCLLVCVEVCWQRRTEGEKLLRGPPGLCPWLVAAFIVSRRGLDRGGGVGGGGGPVILYLSRIYVHFHLASYTIPDTVDVPRQVGSLVPTVGGNPQVPFLS